MPPTCVRELEPLGAALPAVGHPDVHVVLLQRAYHLGRPAGNLLDRPDHARRLRQWGATKAHIVGARGATTHDAISRDWHQPNS